MAGPGLRHAFAGACSAGHDDGGSYCALGALINRRILTPTNRNHDFGGLSCGFTSGRVSVISGIARRGVPPMFSLRIMSWERASSILCCTASYSSA